MQVIKKPFRVVPYHFLREWIWNGSFRLFEISAQGGNRWPPCSHDHRSAQVQAGTVTIGALPAAVAQATGTTVGYLPGLAMRSSADLHPGRAKTEGRDYEVTGKHFACAALEGG